MYQCSPSQIVPFFDEVNGKSMEKLAGDLGKATLANQGKWISLFICSHGGDLDPAFAMYEFVRHILRPQLQTVALGGVRSIAPLLYLMGDHRVITPETTLWFHHFGRRLEEKVRFNTLEAERVQEVLHQHEKKYFRIIEERTGGKTTAGKARALLRNEKTINAKEAVRFGFAHEIVSIKDPQ
jgi:ATP-dependent protease ClpP protease subunit